MINFHIVLPTVILFLAAIDDIKTRKVHNWLTITSFAVAFAYITYTFGYQSLPTAFLSMSVGFLIALPVYYLGIIGGGDLKIFSVFSFLVDTNTVLSVALASLICGFVIGLFQAFLNGSSKKLLYNTISIAATKRHKQNQQQLELHKIPFAVALLFGWISFLIGHHGGAL